MIGAAVLAEAKTAYVGSAHVVSPSEQAFFAFDIAMITAFFA
jgi:hypothetical protein